MAARRTTCAQWQAISTFKAAETPFQSTDASFGSV
jgi:hypothetical protein